MPNTSQVSGGPFRETRRMTLQATPPENGHPAWGTMPPIDAGAPSGSSAPEVKARICLSHSAAVPGYQLPANSAFRVFMTLVSFPRLGAIEPACRWWGIEGHPFYLYTR
jgi:hypothetical protein